jgi:hypothetical protein
LKHEQSGRSDEYAFHVPQSLADQILTGSNCRFSSRRPHRLKLGLYMIPIMPDEEFQKLSEEEQNAQWDRELDSMTEEDWDRFYFNCTGRHLGDPIPPEELVDADEFFENPERFQ